MGTNFQKRNSFNLKFIALLSTVRWKNILVTVLAQYLSFLFAFNTKDALWDSLIEINVHLIIAATAFILAGGYIINNFYDLEKDPKEMNNAFNDPQYKEIIETLKEQLNDKRVALNEDDNAKFPHIQKIIDNHWNN